MNGDGLVKNAIADVILHASLSSTHLHNNGSQCLTKDYQNDHFPYKIIAHDAELLLESITDHDVAV